LADTDDAPAPPLSAARLVDVAEAAGVAIATVSRALNNPGRVNAETRSKVIAAAERLGYASNMAARKLRSGQSRIIMAVMPPWGRGSVLKEILSGVDMELARSRYSLIVGTLNTDRSASPRVVEMARGGLVDGLIAITNEPPADGDLAVLSARLPAVGVMIDLSEHGIPSVITDEAAAIAELTASMVAEGRSYLAYLSGPGSAFPARGPNYHEEQRYAGFLQAAQRVRHCRIEGDFTHAAGERAAQWFLAQEDPPNGIVCANDHMAVALIDALRRRGVRIPEQVAITGFDDEDIARYCYPSLTTVRPALKEMGATSVRLLMQLLSGAISPPIPPRVISATIVRRESF